MLRVINCISILVLLSGCVSGVSHTESVDNLYATISVDRQETHVGEPIKITFTVKNSGRGAPVRTEIIELKSKPVMDIEVGYFTTTFARWSDQQTPDPSLYRLELAPNQSRTITLTWIPDDRAYGKPIRIQGILNWSEERTKDAGVLLPVK
jgi:uncharacterized protein YceK